MLTWGLQVKWWKTAEPETPITTTGLSDTYLISPNNSAFVHRATIGPLAPGTPYRYTAQHVGGGTGQVHDFVGPVADGSAGPVKMLFFGDSGNSKVWAEATVPTVASEVAAGGVDAIIHTGAFVCSCVRSFVLA